MKPEVDEVASNPLIGFPREDKEIDYVENFSLPYLWQRMSIGADGDILTCQCDEMEEMLLGNAAKDSINDVWHGKKLSGIRKAHMQHKGHLTVNPCKVYTYPRKKETAEEIVLDGRPMEVEEYKRRAQVIGRPRRHP